MRKVGLLGALVIGVALAGPAAAQSPLEGPLAAPDAAPAIKAKPKPGKSSHPKKKVAHRETAQPMDTDASSSPAPHPVAHSGHEAPADPVSLGMKWNGNNDDARETRVQNYNGDAAGTGAEVGLKLHF